MAASRPNILLIMPDQHRADWMGGGAGLPVNTPAMTGLAARGTRFRRAVCSSPLCAPSRAGMALGVDFDRNPVRHNGQALAAGDRLFYHRLREAGYRVMTCGKLDLLKPGMSWGADGAHAVEDGESLLSAFGFTAGVDAAGKHDAVLAARSGIPEPFGEFLRQHGLLDLHVADYAERETPSYRNTRPTPLPDFAYGDNWVGATALRLISEAEKAGGPWFLQVNFFGPHEPMDVPRSLIETVAGRPFPVPASLGGIDADEHLEIRRRYAAMIENIDRWLQTFQDVLRSLGELDRTLVVYTSDHGDMLGDRGMWSKMTPYQPSIGIPLIMAGPAAPRGMEIDAAVSNIDFGTTFLDVAGERDPHWGDGQSLLDVAGGGAVADQSRMIGYGCWRAILSRSRKLVMGYRDGVKPTTKDDSPFAYRHGETSVLLFDLDDDPLETRDIAGREPDTVISLARKLGVHLPQHAG